MLDQEQTNELKNQFNVVQVLCGSMLMGAIALTAILFLIKPNRQFNTPIDILGMFGIIIGVVMLIAAIVAPGIMNRKAIEQMGKERESEDGKPSAQLLKRCAGAMLNSTIIRFALIEGMTFANALLWFVEGCSYNLMMSGVGIFMMVILFPFPGRSADTIDRMIQDVNKVRRH